jgi:hypothetical protein
MDALGARLMTEKVLTDVLADGRWKEPPMIQVKQFADCPLGGCDQVDGRCEWCIRHYGKRGK